MLVQQLRIEEPAQVSSWRMQGGTGFEMQKAGSAMLSYVSGATGMSRCVNNHSGYNPLPFLVLLLCNLPIS